MTEHRRGAPAGGASPAGALTPGGALGPDEHVATPEAAARAAASSRPGRARRALVIGYGNSLRSDDGAGWHAAVLAADDARFADVAVLAVHQLTPELALDLSRVEVAVFVDAAVDVAPGAVAVRPVEAASAGGAGAPSSHHVDAGALLAMAWDLFGAAPEAWSVGVGAVSLEPGEELTQAVARALPTVLDAILDRIRAATPPG